MDDLHNIKEELNEFAPELSRMDKREGFQVPPRYFDRLGDEVIRQMKATNTVKEEEKQSIFSLISNFLQGLLQPRLAIGLATIALVFIGFRQFFPGPTSSAEAITFESLADEEFNSYLAEHLYEFEDELLMDLVSEGLYAPEIIEDEEFDIYFQDLNEDLDIRTLEELL